MNAGPTILHVCTTDSFGGAAIAAKRLVIAQRAAGMNAQMLVTNKTGEESWIYAAPISSQLASRIARAVLRKPAAFFADNQKNAFRSLSILPTGLGKAINAMKPDIVHWHWVGSEAISVPEMAEVSAPCVWTCHDEWAWCGAEHYAADARFASGYTGRDVDAVCYRRKERHWRDFAPVLIGPSHWIAGRAKVGKLFGDTRTQVIHNTLDTEIFAPAEQAEARAQLGLPAEGKIVLFGAQGGGADPRKGFDLLTDALSKIQHGGAADMRLVSFGGAEQKNYEIAGLPAQEIGQVRQEQKLAQLYNAADLFVAPSRVDNLPNTMLEALACGTPCAGFDIGGLPDLVSSPMEGELVPAYDCAALAAAILKCAERDDAGQSDAIRGAFLKRFAPALIAQQHSNLYSEVLDSDAD